MQKQSKNHINVDRLIELKPKDDKKCEQLRSMDDYDLDLSKLIAIAATEKVEKVKVLH
jgi:CRISPR-associated protein Csh2